MLKFFDINREDIKRFLIIFFIGIFTHMYVATNRLFTADAVHNGTFRNYILYDISLGKWFAPYYANYMRSYFVLPFVTILFSVIYISIISILLIKLFKIRSFMIGIVIGLLLMVFPQTILVFTINSLSDAYTFGYLLSVLSIYILNKKQNSFYYMVSSLCISLSLGLYQAYIFVYITISCMLVILELWWGEDSFYKIFTNIRKYILCILFGSVIYYILLKLHLVMFDIELSSYKNINSSLTISEDIIDMVKNSYTYVYKFYFTNQILIQDNMKIFYVILILILLYIFVTKIFNTTFRVIVSLLLFFLILPLCMGGIVILSKDIGTNVSILPAMIYSIIFVLVNVDRYILLENKNGKFDKYIKNISLIICILIAQKWYILSNVTYQTQQLLFDKTYAIAIRVLDRLENFELYTKDSKVFIAGGLPSDNYPNTLVQNTNFIYNIEGTNREYALYSGDTFFPFWFSFLGTIVNEEKDIEKINNIKNSEEFNNMPIFPNKDSIRKINGTIVVKLSYV